MKKYLALLFTMPAFAAQEMTLSTGRVGSSQQTIKPPRTSSSSSRLKQELLSPVQTDAKWYLVGGGAALGTALLFKNALINKPQDDISGKRPLGGASKYGDYLGQLIPNALYVGAMGVYGAAGKDKISTHRAWMMAKATAYASAATWVLKASIREPRPDDNSQRDSFPSGHTTTAFAFAGYVAEEHGWAWGIPATLMASFVGYSRINDNRHRVNDVIAGATIGMSFGWGMGRVTDSAIANCQPSIINGGAMLSCPWD